MSNLKMDCPSRSQEKWVLKRGDFFQGLSFLRTNQRKIKFTHVDPFRSFKFGDLEFYDQKGLHGPVSLLESSNGTV
jgi:hypothetical protein